MLLFKREDNGSYTVDIPEWGRYRMQRRQDTIAEVPLRPGEKYGHMEDIQIVTRDLWVGTFHPQRDPGQITYEVEVGRFDADDDGEGKCQRAIKEHYNENLRAIRWRQFMANSDPADLLAHVHPTNPHAAGITGPGVAR
jgi:hypothetical protein